MLRLFTQVEIFFALKGGPVRPGVIGVFGSWVEELCENCQ